jgi:tetratricopeptide (TPR) repeat protein
MTRFSATRRLARKLCMDSRISAWLSGHFSHPAGAVFTPLSRRVATIRSIVCSRNKITFGAAILLLSLGIARIASADGAEQQVCDVRADYALGVEDYSEAIRLHAELIRKHPDNALAHYHLGFAQGMMGNKKAEVIEYQKAAALGLRNWDLFLDLGLAQLEIGELDAATDSLRQAVLLGENHAESHFNLALAYERRGLLADAERETLVSLRLNPRQPDARNLLGVIDAQQGQTVRASLVWRELVRDLPDYQPARTNLALLGSPNEVARGETAAVVPPPAAAVTAIEDERQPPAQRRETELVLVHAKQNGR